MAATVTVTTTAWAQAKSLNTVRVSLDGLAKLRVWLDRLKADCTAGRTPAFLFANTPPIEVIDRLRDMTGKIIRMATTDVAGHSCIMQRYVEAKTSHDWLASQNWMPRFACWL